MRNTCCGIVYENRTIGAILLDAANPNGICQTCGIVERSEEKTPTRAVAATTTTVTAKLVVAPSTMVDTRTVNISTLPTGRIFTNTGVLSSMPAGTRTIKINGTNGMVLVKKASVGDGQAQNCVGKIITIKAAKSPTDGATVLPKEMMQLLNKNTMVEAANGHKFNDNSSDSGYDEMLNEQPNANVSLLLDVNENSVNCINVVCFYLILCRNTQLI